MESENLKKLKILTPTLDSLVIKPVINQGTNIIEYECVDGGTAFGIGLHKEPAVAVQRVFMSKGTKFPVHSHNEHEYVLVYKGRVKVIRDGNTPAKMEKGHSTDKEGILGVGDGVYFSPGEKHSGVILEDTWMISTTIPAGEGYPDG